MTGHMEYAGYSGSVHFSDEDKVYFGKLEFIRDVVTFEATDLMDLRKSFEEAVDDYLQTRSGVPQA